MHLPQRSADASLLALLDRLTGLLERSDLSELEVEAGATGLVLRKPSAIAAPGGGTVVVTPVERGAGRPDPGEPGSHPVARRSRRP